MSVSHVLPIMHPVCRAQCLEHFPPLAILCSRTGTPGLSRGLVTSVLSYGVRLALVLGHASVDMPVRVLANILFPQFFPSLVGGVGSEISYWTMSARMGALKTLGRGWVFWLAAPSAPMMVTVGRDILTVWLVGTVRRPAIVDSTARLGSSKVHFAPTANVCLACARGRRGTTRGSKLGIRCCD